MPPPRRSLSSSELKSVYDSLVKPNPDAITERWNEVVDDLEKCIAEFKKNGGASIPSLDYSELESVKPGTELHDRIKVAGCAVVQNVVPGEVTKRWLDGLAENLEKNPNYTAELRKNAIARIHWSKPQVEARAYPAIVKTAAMMSSLFWSSPPDTEVSLGTNITYEDRFRYQPEGMASWSMGAHIDSAGVRCWDNPSVRETYYPTLSSVSASYRDMDLFDTAGKLKAHDDIERSFRSWQASVTLTDGTPGLALFPNLKLGMAYTLLRPFFAPIDPEEKVGLDKYLSKDNWKLLSESEFQEESTSLTTGLQEDQHPHLRLWQGGMVPVPRQKAGAYMFCVFRIPEGEGTSSVIYIPSAPLCRANVRYLAAQREAFLKSKPADEMGGDPVVEVGYELTAGLDFLKSLGSDAMRNMGFEKFPEVGSEGEIAAKRRANELLFEQAPPVGAAA